MDTDAASARIRRDLAALYFFNFGGLGGLLPFLPLVLSGRGLSPTEIGWVMLLHPISNLLVPPLWGVVADAFEVRMWMLRIAGFGCAVGVLALIPPWGLAGTVAAMALFTFFRAPSVPLANTAALTALGSESHRFARIRLFGSLGFVLFSAGAGQLIGTGRPTQLFSLVAIAYALSSAVTLRIPVGAPGRNPGVLPELIGHLRSAPQLLLLLASLLYYLAHGAYDVYFGLHQRALGRGDGFVGLAWALGVTCEIGVMWLAPRWLRGRSPVPFMMLGAAASVARWSLLAWAESPGLVLAAMTLHGLTFGIWYLALMQFVQAHSGPRIRTSMQAVVAGANGLGMILGYLFGGPVYEAHGGAGTFSMAAVSAAAAFGVYAGLHLTLANARRPG